MYSLDDIRLMFENDVRFQEQFMMRIKIYLLISIILVSYFAVFGQKKVITKPQVPITKIEATTKDGKKVILKSDATWTYSKTEDKPVETTSLYIDVNIPQDFDKDTFYYLAKFSAKSDFYLISQNLENLIATPTLLEIYKNEMGQSHSELKDIKYTPSANYLFLTMERYENIYPIYSNEAKKAFRTAVKFNQTLYTLKENNKVIFDNVPRGKYFLIGFIESHNNEKKYKMWNLEVTLNSQIFTLTLDETNEVKNP